MSRLVALLLLLVGCYHYPEPPVPQGYVFTPRTPSHLDSLLAHTSAVLQGTVTKVEPDWSLDDPCGIVAGLLHRCDGTRAYTVTVQTASGDGAFLIFVPHNDYVPIQPGLTATFLLHKTWVVPYLKCRGIAGMTSNACETLGTYQLAVLSTDDVLPLDALQEKP
jgi:hypothetical protein